MVYSEFIISFNILDNGLRLNQENNYNEEVIGFNCREALLHKKKH